MFYHLRNILCSFWVVFVAFSALPSTSASAEPGVDADGSGVIDYTEFLAATLDRRRGRRDVRRRSQHQRPNG